MVFDTSDNDTVLVGDGLSDGIEPSLLPNVDPRQKKLWHRKAPISTTGNPNNKEKRLRAGEFSSGTRI